MKVCLEGVEARIGKTREDMPWIESEVDDDFRQWIIDFLKNQLPRIEMLLEKYKKDKQVIVFKTREEVEEYTRERMYEK